MEVDNDMKDVDGTQNIVDELKIGLVNNYKRNNDGTKVKFNIEKDTLWAKNMIMETNGRSVCFLENAVFMVEVAVSEHNRPEVKEAKEKELRILEDYDTFELVDDVEQ